MEFIFIVIVAIVFGILIWSLLLRNKKPNQSKTTYNNGAPSTHKASNTLQDPIWERQHEAEPSFTITVSTSYTPAERSTNFSQDVSPDSVWTPAGMYVDVKGYKIKEGLLYFGTGLKSVAKWGVEPALINPDLPVDKGSPDKEGRDLRYWPSYSEITTQSRSAYLEWLANGKKNPDINIGYVFLYYYGLERRLLSDFEKSESARKEADLIAAEISRLLSIYGHNASFNRYATGLLSFAQARGLKTKFYKNPINLDIELDYTSFKIGLGQLAIDGMPLPADWALAWVENDPENRLRTPAYRCKEEFRRLFLIRYSDEIGDGLKLKPNKTKLKIGYHPASSGLSGAEEYEIKTDLPDVTAVTGPIKRLREIANSCVDELDAYSRFIGRYPDEKSSHEALALLPDCLLDKHQSEELKNIFDWLDKNLPQETAIFDLKTIIGLFPSFATEKFTKRESVALAQLLSKIGIGIEPDVRFGSSLPKPEQKAVLFRVQKDSANAPTSEYLAAASILHLSAAVANADGSISVDEEKHLEEHLESLLHLSMDEKVRLKAYTKCLLAAPPGITGIKKRIEPLDANERETIGRFLVGIAQSDGSIDPNEIKLLSKIYNLLGLNAQDLYSHAHKAAIEPVTVKPKESAEKKYALPSAPEKKAAVSLDMETIEAKLAETAAVSALLSNIFVEEDEEASSTARVETSKNIKEKTVAGLDVENSRLMLKLAGKDTWSREELEKIAATMNLMLDGALDSINDASYETYGEPFFEGEDPIEINPTIAREIADENTSKGT
ncbi:MAG: TerB N-terminal domain-containing protein [Candidatus Methylomirabilis sp.]|nr:TerB N-terminal domain-containing protein [Deltaproteobacteria bacterium]